MGNLPLISCVHEGMMAHQDWEYEGGGHGAPALPDLTERVRSVLEDDAPNKWVWKSHASQSEWIRGTLLPLIRDLSARTQSPEIAEALEAAGCMSTGPDGETRYVHSSYAKVAAVFARLLAASIGSRPVGDVGTERRLVIQLPDGTFHQAGYDCPDTKVRNALRATDRAGYLYLSDAQMCGCLDAGEVGYEIVEIEVTARLTGRRQADLYTDGELND